MAGLSRRANGRWGVSVYAGKVAGKSVSTWTYFETKDEAETYMAENGLRRATRTPCRSDKDPVPTPEVFWPRVDQTGDCWLWQGTVDEDGYGKYGSNGAHRAAYRLVVGPIPDGLELDHLCRNPSCVNPAHLEPVTHAENQRRRALAITHCRHGHEFTEDNTGRRGASRYCKACDRRTSREYAQAKRTKVSA